MMYKTFRKFQHSFFYSSEDVLKHFSKRFELSTNQHGLFVLKVDGKFVASFYPHQKEDAILYYGDLEVFRTLSKG